MKRLLATLLLPVALFAAEPEVKTTTEKFKDWEYSCVEVKKENRCVIKQAAFNQGKMLSQLVVSFSKTKEAQFQLSVPHFVNLKSKVKVSIGSFTKELDYFFCDPRGCYIVEPISKRVQKKMREGKEIHFNTQLINGKKVDIKYSLSGFSSAFNRLMK